MVESAGELAETEWENLVTQVDTLRDQSGGFARPAKLGLAAEPWFVAAKLSAIAVAMTVGWALVLRMGHNDVSELP